MRVHIWTLCGRLDAVVQAISLRFASRPSRTRMSMPVSAPCFLSAFVSKTQISDPAFLLSVVIYMVIISCTTHPS